MGGTRTGGGNSAVILLVCSASGRAVMVTMVRSRNVDETWLSDEVPPVDLADRRMRGRSNFLTVES